MTPAELAALHARCFTLPPAWDANAFAGFMADPTCTLICEGSQAFILVRHVVGEIEVLTLATDPAIRRQGLARALLRRALAAFPMAEACFLEVAAPNTAARALYDSLGFVQVGLRAAYYCNPQGQTADALVLRASLPLADAT